MQPHGIPGKYRAKILQRARLDDITKEPEDLMNELEIFR